MFSESAKFNQDLGRWNVQNLKYAHRMFYDAEAFRQNLCSWGDKIANKYEFRATEMFKGTTCPDTTDPDLSFDDTMGPFCYPCE